MGERNFETSDYNRPPSALLALSRRHLFHHSHFTCIREIPTGRQEVQPRSIGPVQLPTLAVRYSFCYIMKQLLHTFSSHNGNDYFFVVALQDRAFVGSFATNSRLVELQKQSDDADGGTAGAAAADDDPPRTGDTPQDSSGGAGGGIPLQQIQAVAGCCVVHNAAAAKSSDVSIFCAVARQSKQLAIYCVTLADILVIADADASAESSSSQSTKRVLPLTIHHSPKRVSSMVFAKIPTSNTTSLSSSDTTTTTTAPPLTVLITGDLAGDAFAYSLTQASTEITAKEAANENRLPHRRLLLGHTASMLTSVALISTSSSSSDSSNSDRDAGSKQFILTADRDEKIRVTAFPSTFEIHGFLFGHTAFVSCMTTVDTVNQHRHLCFSCGGDHTLRIWDCLKCTQLACLDLQSGLGVPCDVCVGHDKETGDCVVAVIYDQSLQLDLFTFGKGGDENDGSKPKISERRQVLLSAQPLGLVSVGTYMVVLLQEPHYLQSYDWNGNVYDLSSSSPCLQFVKDLATESQIALPKAILERDETNGELKMSKNSENRGSVMTMPWNNVERRETFSKKRMRRNMRRRNKDKKAKGATKDVDQEENGSDLDSNGEDGDEILQEREE